MKRLNKLLLAGAALAGVMAPSVNAAVDIQVTDGPGNLAAEYDQLTRANTVGNAIQNLYNELSNRFPGELAINLVQPAILAAIDPNTAATVQLVEFATLKTLTRLTRTPIVADSLRRRAQNDGTSFRIDFYLQNDVEPWVSASTGHDSMSVYIQPLNDKLQQGLLVNSLGRTATMLDMFALSQMHLDRLQGGNAPEFTPHATLLSFAIANTAHEIGHLVARVQTALDSFRRTGHYRQNDESTEAWMGAFFRSLYERLEQVVAVPGGDYNQVMRLTHYAHSSIAERFAEHFCEAALRSSHSGTGVRATAFDETLTNMTHCRGPHNETCMTYIPALA